MSRLCSKKIATQLQLSIASIALCGCAATSIREIKSSPAATTSFETNINYQRLYKNLVTKFSECMGEGYVGGFATTHIKHALYSDLKEATISYTMDNLGQNIYYHADIIGTEKGSKVIAYVSLNTWKRTLDNTKNWATDADAPC